MLTNMELTNILAGTSSTEKSSASSGSSKSQQKRKTSEDSWKMAFSKKKLGEDTDLLLESSSSDSTSRSTALSQDATSENPNSLGFHTELDFHNIDPTELIANAEKGGIEFDGADDLGEVEDMLVHTTREHKLQKNRDKSPLTPSILQDSEGKPLTSPTISITPIQTSSGLGFQQGSATHERRTSIEIIPLSTTTSSPTLPTSITITPIAPSKSEERSRDKKSSKSRSDDKSKTEKKRKRKREESPMGPPEKLPMKQDALTKPISVSIKPSETPPLTITPTSPSMVRKFDTSPTPNRSMSNLSGKVSPNLMKSGLKTGSIPHHR